MIASMKLKDEKLIKALFPDIVGQSQTKRKLAFFMENSRETHIFPNVFFVAPKGTGKTLMSRAIGANLMRTDKSGPKEFVEINTSTLKNLKQFMNQVALQHIQDKEVTIFFDEASELPKDLTMALLTMLAPNKDNRNYFSYDDYTFEIDFRRHTFLFATTESQDVFEPLKDRLERVELEDYTLPELGEIMQKRLPDIKVSQDLILDIASVLRGNPRAADSMGGHIINYLKRQKKKELAKRDWDTVKEYLALLPLGLSEIELRILNLLYQRAKDPISGGKGYSLLHLASITGMTTQSLQRDLEPYLLRHMLIEKESRGRVISSRGMDYIRNLRKSRGEDLKE
jgi:Holliday junction DNA helicase RuvB